MNQLFTASMQPATRFVDRTFERARWWRFNRRRLFYCYGCGRRRWASKLRVQVFYDGWRFWCKEGCEKRK